MIRMPSFPVFALLLAACGGPADTADQGDPDIAVSPDALVFFGVALGYTEYGVVEVSNEGAGTLHLEAIRVTGSSSFDVTVPDDTEVQPRTLQDLVVRYVAASDEDVATLQIESDDPDTPLVEVALTGSTGPDPYVDADGDGFTPSEGDCDETDAAVHPGASEACNGVDDDCDGEVDEDYDRDGDGYLIVTCLDGDDCNDGNAAIHPGATELENGVDDDCDGAIDDGTGVYDDDGDCWCENPTCTGSIRVGCPSLAGGDCDDTDPDVNPGESDVCDDGIDNDCDSVVDDGSEPDADGDGWRVCEGDCDDGDPTISPDTPWYLDRDDDSFGWSFTSVRQCMPPEGYVLDATDCYDRSSEAYPGATDYYSTDRGDASYDYDCDGAETPEYTATFSCTGTSCGTHTDGWTTGTPACGESGTWATSCYRSGGSCVASGTSTRTQSCR